MLHFLAVRKQMAQALGNMPSLAGKLLRAPVTGRTPCSANVACGTPPEGPSLDDQSVINGKIMLGALSARKRVRADEWFEYASGSSPYQAIWMTGAPIGVQE
ncbi:hypothetical protein CCUS01_03262 [Colletotrichum cuscutae]|uniref:Uncharacterized protein n=1 Tax=Colletotrichum cuscutae TaxID=1209917 RepID=A0AAI9Y9Z3_9PEZI|nr:hypothetical protein CCUS01_03262 [Colletotrichum cuscutae]